VPNVDSFHVGHHRFQPDVPPIEPVLCRRTLLRHVGCPTRGFHHGKVGIPHQVLFTVSLVKTANVLPVEPATFLASWAGLSEAQMPGRGQVTVRETIVTPPVVVAPAPVVVAPTRVKTRPYKVVVKEKRGVVARTLAVVTTPVVTETRVMR